MRWSRSARRPLGFYRLVARRAETGTHSAQMPFLAYLINVALEEANGEKANRG
jgi:hypothetical protein